MDKLIPVDELLRIVTEAGMHHQRDFYETSLSGLIVKGGDPYVDRDSAYELAAALDIPEEKIAAVIANRYPSTKDQLHALETHGAVATTRAVARTYQTEILYTLRAALPTTVFTGTLETARRVYDQPHLKHKWQQDYTVRFHMVEESQATVSVKPAWHNIFGIRGPREQFEMRKEELLLATVRVGNELQPARSSHRDRVRLYRGKRLHLVITVGSGFFVKLCDPVLATLRERFDRHNGVAMHDVAYDYVVE